MTAFLVAIAIAGLIALAAAAATGVLYMRPDPGRRSAPSRLDPARNRVTGARLSAYGWTVPLRCRISSRQFGRYLRSELRVALEGIDPEPRGEHPYPGDGCWYPRYDGAVVVGPDGELSVRVLRKPLPVMPGLRDAARLSPTVLREPAPGRVRDTAPQTALVRPYVTDGKGYR